MAVLERFLPNAGDLEGTLGGDLKPIAWPPILLLAAIKLAFHVVAAGWLTWGYMTDELYYLDSVDRLDWGFVDHPPLSIAFLRIVRDTLGDSILALRTAAALFGVGTVVLTGLIAREMGGGRRAQGLAALAALCAPIYLALSGFYSMNPIEQMLWPLAMLVLLHIFNGGRPELWLVLGMVLAVGMLNKVSMLWLGIGLGAGLVLTPARRWLRTPWPWAAAAIGVAGLVPSAWWQAEHGWPFLEFSRNAAQYKVGHVTLVAFMGEQVLGMNTLAAPLWIGGLVYALASEVLRPYRPLAWMFVVVFALLAASGSARSHYLAPAYPPILAAGAIGVERLARRRAWIPVAAGALLLIGAGFSVPLTLPLLSPSATIAYQSWLGLRPRQELERGGILPMHLALYFHPEAVLNAVQDVYDSLPPEDRARVEILTGSFGETGAINVLGRARGLPRSIGTHNQYWLWGPGTDTGDLMIVVHESEDELRRWFGSCERRGEIECPLCMEQMDAKAVYVCRDPRRPLRDMWLEMKLYR